MLLLTASSVTFTDVALADQAPATGESQPSEGQTPSVTRGKTGSEASVFPASVPRSDIEIKVEVSEFRGGQIMLSGGWRQQLMVGMVVNLLDTSGNIVSKARLDRVTASTSQATLIGSVQPNANPSQAVTPFPLIISGIDQQTVFFSLPRANRQLQPGSVLSVIRGGEVVASLKFENYLPVSAQIESVKPNITLQVGDVCWAVEPQQVSANLALEPFSAPASQDAPVPLDSLSRDRLASLLAPDAGTGRGAKEAGASDNVTTPPASQAKTLGEKIRSEKRRLVGAQSPWLSRSGATGLLRMPSADMTPDGEVLVTGFFGNEPDSGLDPALGRIGGGTKYAGTIGFIPRVELGVTVGSDVAARDLNGNAKIQILKEERGRPALAVGAAEIKKLAGQPLLSNQNYGTTYYVAATKNLFTDRVRATLGIAHQKDTKPYAGAEIGLVHGLSVVLEHDGDDLNYGVRTSFLNDYAQVGAQHFNNGWAAQVGLRVPLGTRRKNYSTTQLPALGRDLADADAAKVIQERLIEAGLENVRVRLMAPTRFEDETSQIANLLDPSAGRIEVTYENRSFPLNEIDALAYVLANVSVYAPQSVKRTSIIIKRASLTVLRVDTSLDNYRRFIAGDLDARTFTSALTIENSEPSTEAVSSVTADTTTGATPYGKADLLLRPRLRTEIATEAYVLGLGLGVQPEIDLPLGRGAGLNIQGDVPLLGPLRGDNAKLNRFAVRLLSNPIPSVLLGAYAGRFRDERNGINERDGALAEAILRTRSGMWQGRVVAGRLSPSIGQGTDTTLVGEARYYYPNLDLSARVTGGRYIDGDKGFTLGLLRRFGDTEVGIEARDTDTGRIGLLRLAVPIGPHHLSSKPSTLRIRPADFFEYSQRSLLTSPNFLSVARATGNQIDLGPDVNDTLLGRDRLNRAYIVRSIEQFKRVGNLDFSPPLRSLSERTP